ncbi:hypothetical protein MYCTH_2119794 [Thermothelomyces thermophilus ATCC 42464]|uniref:FAD-binding domain-containing protein n=1 Tax=Thermothelomyces thermophilus (strain ATCC 42464 / BCRC 31852 / DSM 1799) TaxID=573729 RepID=G2QJ60_THET4|nr:uncharacterized protein MYCTH_2119794 [Thermothelomyces thermophilus ATCC 42464]AEO59635.1 hypothetical protein MYCTH_2119794 [Thermothelomyces thermophilus ATCC 42464]
MATKRPDYTWVNGYQQLPEHPKTNGSAVENDVPADDDPTAYVTPPSVELVTSPAHNHFGVNVIRSWPTMYDGTNSPHGIPEWWKPKPQVDVLIVGAGPSGLGLAATLARQGVSFRIIDKADAPLAAGRADGVQPRFLETIGKWGLASEVAEEGPIIERTAMYKDGEKLIFNRSHQSDSRYRGLHVITQGQIERIYIRDLLRHKAIVERSRTLSAFEVLPTDGSANDEPYPVRATVRNQKTGEEEAIQAKFLVGSDGGASSIRKSLGIPFDGHGCCAIIPREDGYIRLYTQLDISHTGPISQSRQARDPTFAESGGKVEVHSITPEEVLEQANKVFAPYKLKFGAPLSWFAIWKISERVARTYSSPDMWVHLAGDAAHVHSVLGAFGLNASILDVCNLGWKLGLASKGLADHKTLLPTYTSERRKHASRIIRVSGEYLRFISGSTLGVPDLDEPEKLEAAQIDGQGQGPVSGSNGVHSGHNFVGRFFKTNGQFLLGVDCPYDESVVAPRRSVDGSSGRAAAIEVRNGVRAPNPRVCFETEKTGYLYDALSGAGRFHLVVFASSLQGAEVRRRVGEFARSLVDPEGFHRRFGGETLFQVVLVVKLMPWEFEQFEASDAGRELLAPLRRFASTVVVFDDRSPDEDAHTTYGVNHRTGAVAVIRPDLWVGASAYPDETDKIAAYFEGFLTA